MSRDVPYIFALIASNERAKAVIESQQNSHLISAIVIPNDPSPARGLGIGFHISSKSRYTLATIGRIGDIFVDGAGISRIQCSFEIHDGNETEVMLQDRSSNCTTRFFGASAMSFESWRPHRRVVVDPTVNLEFGFGGVNCDLYRFQIVWHGTESLSKSKYLEHRGDNPRETRTVLDIPPTIAPTGPVTRIHTPAGKGWIRYSDRGKLGRGAFGEVWKVVNVDTGGYIAVKRVQKTPLMERSKYAALKREVETLSRIAHNNIIAYQTAQWEGNQLHIFMDLMPGSVEDLISKNIFILERDLSKPFLHQMLQALDYLACRGIIHRDVKPENILCSPRPLGGYQYKLADFGLANLAADAQTIAGSPPYMAPELVRQESQTTKIDVWSLFVTLTFALDVASFRSKPLHTLEQKIEAVHAAAATSLLRPLRGMVVVDPSQRSSAADILDKVFDGEGRTSPNRPRVEEIGREGTGLGGRRDKEPERDAVVQNHPTEPVERTGERQRPHKDSLVLQRRKRMRLGDSELEPPRNPADYTTTLDTATPGPSTQKRRSLIQNDGGDDGGDDDNSSNNKDDVDGEPFPEEQMFSRTAEYPGASLKESRLIDLPRRPSY